MPIVLSGSITPTTGGQIVQASLRKLVVHDPGETLSSEAMSAGIEALNDLLALWSAEGIHLYATTQESFTLTSAQSYSIGAGGIVNTARPIEIIQAFTRINGIDYPCQIIEKSEYNNFTDKSVTGSYPTSLAYASEYPLGLIYVYPVSTGTLYIESRKLLQQFANSSTQYSMPEEQLLAIKTNLSKILAPEYGKPLDPNLAEQAETFKNVLKSLYVKVPRARFDFGVGNYDVRSDTYI